MSHAYGIRVIGQQFMLFSVFFSKNFYSEASAADFNFKFVCRSFFTYTRCSMTSDTLHTIWTSNTVSTSPAANFTISTYWSRIFSSSQISTQHSQKSYTGKYRNNNDLKIFKIFAIATRYICQRNKQHLK